MKLFLIAALMIAGIAPAWADELGPDHLYIYTPTGNQSYHCTVYLSYVEGTGHSVYYADDCVATSRDNAIWPQFPPQPIRVSLDFRSPKFQRLERDCQFVASALAVNRTTSTVVDCRGQANAAATAR